MSEPVHLAAASSHPTDLALAARVLRPYKPHCRYLTSAEVWVRPDAPAPLGASCCFVIPESCYIDDTGHFNSVEFNICYNQITYYVLAKAVQDHLWTVFDTWTMEDYWAKQLPNILILSMQTRFRRQIRSRGAGFQGEIEFSRRRLSRDTLFLGSQCRFWDDHGGSCEGNINLGLVDVPR
jgi:hypothetical protein